MAISNDCTPKDQLTLSHEEENVSLPNLSLELVEVVVHYLDLLGLQLMAQVSHLWKKKCLMQAKKQLVFPLNNMLRFLSQNLEAFNYDCRIESEIGDLDNWGAIINKQCIFKEKIRSVMRTLRFVEFEKLKQQATRDVQIFLLFKEYAKQLEEEKKLKTAILSLHNLMSIKQ